MADQFIQGKDLRPVVVGPPEKCQEVDHGLWEVALRLVLADRSGAVPLGELLAVLPQDDGRVGELGGLEAEGVVDPDLLGRVR